MTDFKKWFAARARNPDKITLEEAFSAGKQSAPSVPEGWQEGVKAVADMLQKKADDYAIEHGHDDMGGLSFGGGMGGEIKMDHYTSMIELIEEVEAMLAAAQEAKP